MAVLRGNQLYVANAGDSRCVLSREGRAIPLSADHKPEDEPEEKRILNAGGVVTGDGRVNGGLNLSRAIGKPNETNELSGARLDTEAYSIPDTSLMIKTATVHFARLDKCGSCCYFFNSSSKRGSVLQSYYFDDQRMRTG